MKAVSIMEKNDERLSFTLSELIDSYRLISDNAEELDRFIVKLRRLSTDLSDEFSERLSEDCEKLSVICAEARDVADKLRYSIEQYTACSEKEKEVLNAVDRI